MCTPMGVVYALWLISIQMHICMSSQQWHLVYALWQEIPKLVYAFFTLQPVISNSQKFECTRFLDFPLSPAANNECFLIWNLMTDTNLSSLWNELNELNELESQVSKRQTLLQPP